MEKSEIKRAVKRQKIKPSELFDKFDLREDPAMKKMINQEVEFELEYRDQQAEEEINKELEKEVKEDKLEINDMIPGISDLEDLPQKTDEEKKKKYDKKSEDDDLNSMIPDAETQGESGDDDDLIPD